MHGASARVRGAICERARGALAFRLSLLCLFYHAKSQFHAIPPFAIPPPRASSDPPRPMPDLAISTPTPDRRLGCGISGFWAVPVPGSRWMCVCVAF